MDSFKSDWLRKNLNFNFLLAIFTKPHQILINYECVNIGRCEPTQNIT